MEELTAFLFKHPYETIFIRLKEDDNPVGNTRTFAESVEFYLVAYRYIIYRR